MKKLTLVVALLSGCCFVTEATRQSDNIEHVTRNQPNCTNIQPNRNSNIEETSHDWRNVADLVTDNENLDVLVTGHNSQENSETENLDRSCCHYWCDMNRARMASCTSGAGFCFIGSVTTLGAFDLCGIVIQYNNNIGRNADFIVASAVGLFVIGFVTLMKGCYYVSDAIGGESDDSSDD